MTPPAEGERARAREKVYSILRGICETDEPKSGVRVGMLSFNETVAFDAIMALLDEVRAPQPSGLNAAQPPTMSDAAELLWGVVANASGGNWTLQSAEWQGAAVRAREAYHAALARLTPPTGPQTP